MGCAFRAGVGKFSAGMALENALEEGQRVLMERALAFGNVITESGVTLVPLIVRGNDGRARLSRERDRQ